MTREDLIKLARLAVAGIHRPEDCENPVAYDPPEWVVEAMAAAWKAGTVEANAKVVDWVALVAFIDAIPCLEITDHEVIINHQIIVERDGTGVSGAMLLATMRDWMKGPPENQHRLPPPVPTPSHSSSAKTPRMKRKR